MQAQLHKHKQRLIHEIVNINEWNPIVLWLKTIKLKSELLALQRFLYTPKSEAPVEDMKKDMSNWLKYWYGQINFAGEEKNG